MLDDIIEFVIELVATIFFDTYDFDTGSKRFRKGWVIFLSVAILATIIACIYFFVTTDDGLEWLYGTGAVVLVIMEICLLRKYFRIK
ncbi:MAG: hypothetical protein J6A05_06355 [Oscillospiraceae bacterium]|nr:hypothetical protein [Oscillospiraceae bacterium]